MSDLWVCDLNRADGTSQRNAAGDMVAMLQAWGVLVPATVDDLLAALPVHPVTYVMQRFSPPKDMALNERVAYKEGVYAACELFMAALGYSE